MEFPARNAETSLGMRLSTAQTPTQRGFCVPGWGFHSRPGSPRPLKRLPREVYAFPAGNSIPGRDLPDRSNPAWILFRQDSAIQSRNPMFAKRLAMAEPKDNRGRTRTQRQEDTRRTTLRRRLLREKAALFDQRSCEFLEGAAPAASAASAAGSAHRASPSPHGLVPEEAQDSPEDPWGAALRSRKALQRISKENLVLESQNYILKKLLSPNQQRCFMMEWREVEPTLAALQPLL